MANKKISLLDEIISPDIDDLLHVIDINESENKKITFDNLMKSIAEAYVSDLLKTDIINEYTPDLGVTIENIILKDGNLNIPGDLTVNGTTVTQNTETVLIEDNTLVVNNGETGAGILKGFAGLVIDRGSLDNYFFGFDEVRDAFVAGEITEETLGEIAACQVMATRQDSPIDQGIAVWNDTNKRFDTTDQFIFDSASGFAGIGTIYPNAKLE
ncbi:hypothetical protein KKC59_00295, partial [bacterium]|nr:hypothetical protein [bacterium]